jgi:hypothetical protein
MKRVGAAAAAAVALALSPAAAPASSPPRADGARACVPHVLKATRQLRHKLRAVHLKLLRKSGGNTDFTGPVGRVYYGRCGHGTFWAAASLKDSRLGTQDQPEIFNRKPGHAWRDRGDTGGDVAARVPAPLARAWGF